VHQVSDSRGTWDGRGSVHPIRTLGDPVLRQACDDVEVFDSSLCRLIEDMFATMYSVDGIGLAANQIGVSRNIFVFDCPDGTGQFHRGHMVNPIRTFVDSDSSEDSEGCLSIPGVYAEFSRSAHVIVEGADQGGESFTIAGQGYFARCLLHETQHLEGKLYIDLLTGDTRKETLKEIRQLDLDNGKMRTFERESENARRDRNLGFS
jgi:peptide deformylase